MGTFTGVTHGGVRVCPPTLLLWGVFRTLIPSQVNPWGVGFRSCSHLGWGYGVQRSGFTHAPSHPPAPPAWEDSVHGYKCEEELRRHSPPSPLPDPVLLKPVSLHFLHSIPFSPPSSDICGHPGGALWAPDVQLALSRCGPPHPFTPGSQTLGGQLRPGKAAVPRRLLPIQP